MICTSCTDHIIDGVCFDCYEKEKGRFDDWKPTVENINALPEGLRRYVHDLETMCDPTGLVQENAGLKDDIDALVNALQEERKLPGSKLIQF